MKTLTIIKNLIYVPILWVGLPIENYGILFVLMVIDIITGVIASYVINGKHSLKSHIFASGVTSKLLMLTVPLVLALVAKGVGIDIIKVATHALSLFVLSEGYSIIGNYISIKQKKYVEEFDAMSFVLRKIQESILSIISKK